MSGVRYLPGEDWLCVVRSGVALMVPATTTADVVDRLWNQLGRNPNLQAILPIVAGGFGQGLESMPPFAVVSYIDRLHVLLRGEVRLRVAGDDGQAPLELSGEYVTTWTERMLDGDARHFSLSAGPAGMTAVALTSDEEFEESALPLEAGIVRSSVVRVNLSGAVGAPIVEAEPAPPAHIAPVPVAPAPVQDPERAMTGALEAEESATINPNLYLTFSQDAEEEATEDESEAPEAGDQPVQQEDPVQRDTERDHQPEEDPESHTTGYDHLWDQTVVRRVEDAAVRPAEEEDPTGEASDDPAETDQPDSEDDSPDVPDQVKESRAGGSSPTSGPLAEPRPVPPVAPGQLIDSVPWARKSPAAPEAPAVPALSPAPPGAGFPLPSAPHASGPQVPGTQSPGQAQPAGPGTVSDGPDLDDHDGQTIMRSDLKSPAPAPAQPSPDLRPGTGPLVLARLCPQGHANPPEASTCGGCSQPLDGEPREVRRPSLGTMRISTGEVVELDQSLVIGRQPSVSRVQGRGMPKLVQVTSAGGDISRSHAEVRLDGWHVLLCDLKATNGTVLIRQGQPPRRLGEGETAFLLDGDVAQLGDDVFLRFEGLR